MLFHPLYNADKSLSKVRLACLIVVGVCMISYPFVSNIHVSEVKEKESHAVAPTKKSMIAKIMETDEEKLQSKRAKIRNEVLLELKNRYEFLQSCGTINAGFEGCSIKFTDALLEYYDARVSTAADGFNMTIIAKGDMKNDICIQFSLNSNGDFVALDQNNKPTQKCTPKDFIKQNLGAVYRATDHIQGRQAPSGLSPIEVNTAAKRTLDKQDVRSLN